MNLSLCFSGSSRQCQIVGRGLIAAWCLVAAASGAMAVEYRIDRLTVERNGIAIFDDEFDDGLPPPDGKTFIGSATAGYTANRVVGDFSGAESNGKLTLDPTHRGVATVNPLTGQPEGILFQAAYLNVNTQSTPDTAERGLKINHTFTVSATFDLVTPGPTTQFDSYGLRLADFDNRGPSGWNDLLDLQIFKDRSSGLPKLGLFHRDLRNGTRTLLETALLDPTLGDQVELTFSKAVVNDPTVRASYRYLSGGALLGTATAFSATGTLFHGEVFTRPGFFAVAQVPEPATWAMMIGGLLLAVGISRKGLRASTRNA
jgi:hypothetical protein